MPSHDNGIFLSYVFVNESLNDKPSGATGTLATGTLVCTPRAFNKVRKKSSIRVPCAGQCTTSTLRDDPYL